MNYVHTFKNLSEQEEYYNSSAYTEPCVSSVMGENVRFNKAQVAPAYVDLGLPSGTLWGIKNIGADSETDYGQYFAWGEVTGYYDSQVGVDKVFNYQNYRFYPVSETKYNGRDEKTVLDNEDDAAYTILGSNWNIPTSTQFDELTASTTQTWVSDYNGSGVSGMLFTAQNGNTLFFPAEGYAYENATGGIGDSGTYWSNKVDETNLENAIVLSFDQNGITAPSESSTTRFMGFAVRGVIG